MDFQKFCLKWESTGFQGGVTSVFDQLHSGGELLDVTLCCEGQHVRAHRGMLSACSPYLRELLKRKLKESVAAKLPEGTYLHQPPSRYIFPGAEVLVDPDDSDSDRDSLNSDRGSDDESPTAEGDHLNNSTDTPETAVTPTHTDSCPPTPPGRTTTSGASSGAPGTSSAPPAEEQPSSTPAVNPSSTSDIEMEPETAVT
ncbi:broad-complex core protein isoforms 1/2/3/4/5-like [Amphibalanus amphitrite]|uniref:broad-complex core protein isoforms 1/2/3/4/5-like n=1 Tax=Amphibalanus amphitrite TaxID=1232801 RepID=UPI001C90BB3E|nr:broad-complex core protein isoforms 1/2/3/4/5-like [Amphibalanus amphitrite]